MTSIAALEQRQLDLGDGGNRNLGRQHVVQHMVVAQIGVGQHIVADRLAGPQAAAMADHQPGLGPHHRQVVADRLGVGRADADVDQGDAVAVRRRSGDRPASGAAASAPSATAASASGVSPGDIDAAGGRQRRVGLSVAPSAPRRPSARTRRHSGGSW